MLNSAINSGIRDNHLRGAVAEFLKAKIHAGSRLSVVSAYFTIYAYEVLREHLDQIEHLDFLFGEPRFITSLDPDKTEKKAFILDGNWGESPSSRSRLRWIKENDAFAQSGAGQTPEVLNARIRARFLPIRHAYDDFLKRHPDHARAHIMCTGLEQRTD